MARTSDLGLLRRHLRSALVSDALDNVGLRSQCLSATIVPVVPGIVAVGRAFTAKHVLVNEIPETPYTGLLRALDEVGLDDVFITSSDGPRDVALWGELVSTACQARGAAGAVIDGLVRDVARIRALEFPVFSSGTIPYDVKGRMDLVAHGIPIEVGGVHVEPGWLIVGDDDGVVVVPADVEDEVVGQALEKAKGEDRFRQAVRKGMAPSRAFERYKVL